MLYNFSLFTSFIWCNKRGCWFLGFRWWFKFGCYENINLCCCVKCVKFFLFFLVFVLIFFSKIWWFRPHFSFYHSVAWLQSLSNFLFSFYSIYLFSWFEFRTTKYFSAFCKQSNAKTWKAISSRRKIIWDYWWKQEENPKNDKLLWLYS